MGKSFLTEVNAAIPDLAWGCSYDCNWLPEKTIVKAAGGLIATPKNYAKLLFPLMNGGKNQSLNRQVFEPEVIEHILEPAFHIDSSNTTCTNDSQCSSNHSNTFAMCFKNKCKEVIKEDADAEWKNSYGLGLKLHGDILADGFFNTLEHGGAQPGFRSWFRIKRQEKSGIIFMINGTREIIMHGHSFGSDGPENALTKAYKNTY